MPRVTSDWEARHAGHVLEGLGAMHIPQIQQRMVAAVPAECWFASPEMKELIGCDDISMVLKGLNDVVAIDLATGYYYLFFRDG